MLKFFVLFGFVTLSLGASTKNRTADKTEDSGKSSIKEEQVHHTFVVLGASVSCVLNVDLPINVD